MVKNLKDDFLKKFIAEAEDLDLLRPHDDASFPPASQRQKNHRQTART